VTPESQAVTHIGDAVAAYLLAWRPDPAVRVVSDLMPALVTMQLAHQVFGEAAPLGSGGPVPSHTQLSDRDAYPLRMTLLDRYPNGILAFYVLQGSIRLNDVIMFAADPNDTVAEVTEMRLCPHVDPAQVDGVPSVAAGGTLAEAGAGSIVSIRLKRQSGAFKAKPRRFSIAGEATISGFPVVEDVLRLVVSVSANEAQQKAFLKTSVALLGYGGTTAATVQGVYQPPGKRELHLTVPTLELNSTLVLLGPRQQQRQLPASWSSVLREANAPHAPAANKLFCGAHACVFRADGKPGHVACTAARVQSSHAKLEAFRFFATLAALPAPERSRLVPSNAEALSLWREYWRFAELCDARKFKLENTLTEPANRSVDSAFKFTAGWLALVFPPQGDFDPATETTSLEILCRSVAHECHTTLEFDMLAPGHFSTANSSPTTTLLGLVQRALGSKPLGTIFKDCRAVAEASRAIANRAARGGVMPLGSGLFRAYTVPNPRALGSKTDYLAAVPRFYLTISKTPESFRAVVGMLSELGGSSALILEAVGDHIARHNWGEVSMIALEAPTDTLGSIPFWCTVLRDTDASAGKALVKLLFLRPFSLPLAWTYDAAFGAAIGSVQVAALAPLRAACPAKTTVNVVALVVNSLLRSAFWKVHNKKSTKTTQRQAPPPLNVIWLITQFAVKANTP
jgi:hypothetical protein